MITQLPVKKPATTEHGASRQGEVLRLVGLTKRFGNGTGTVTAVDVVNLDIQPGEFLTLLGPSGCGKTTMLRMIAGFEEASDGRILLGERNIDVLPANKRPMAMVFQNYALFPHLSVFENVAYGLKVLGKSRQEVAEAVEMALVSMNLTGLAQRDPHQLSGGQQQRVALARAMVMKPDVLLFDEPLSNLDAKLRVQMRNEIRDLQRRIGITSVYVTHDQEEAMALSDRIVVMNKGRVEQVGSPAELYLHPASVFVADFLGHANFLAVQVEGIADGNAKVLALGGSYLVPAHPECAMGKPMVLLVRPESMIVEPAAEQEANAHVVSTVFLGAHAELRLETADGTLSAVITAADPERLPAPGSPVAVSFAAHRTYLLPE
jgi:iron(III) transport system ATP-binding protein